MVLKIIVAGCRDYNNYTQAKKYIEMCISRIKNSHELVFISGGCRGADRLGEQFAVQNGYKIERFPAEWDKYGKVAGPKRNFKMAQQCDCVICFWDGKSRGTKSLIEYAKQLGKPIRIKYI